MTATLSRLSCALLTVAALLLTVGVTGCATVYSETPATAPEPPPAPREDVQPNPPAARMAWVPGRWVWRSAPKRFEWTPGKYIPIRHRFHKHWIPGAWETTRNGYAWVPGKWR